MKLLKDTILVLLPPQEQQERTRSGLHLAHALPPPATHGRVRMVGPHVREVKPGDMVAFSPDDGEPLPLEGYPHLVIRESAIIGTVEKRENA